MGSAAGAGQAPVGGATDMHSGGPAWRGAAARLQALTRLSGALNTLCIHSMVDRISPSGLRSARRSGGRALSRTAPSRQSPLAARCGEVSDTDGAGDRRQGRAWPGGSRPLVAAGPRVRMCRQAHPLWGTVKLQHASGRLHYCQSEQRLICGTPGHGGPAVRGLAWQGGRRAASQQQGCARHAGLVPGVGSLTAMQLCKPMMAHRCSGGVSYRAWAAGRAPRAAGRGSMAGRWRGAGACVAPRLKPGS